MVQIIGFKEKEKEDGTPFCLLELQGSVEMTLSKAGQFYATAKKAYIASTFDKQTCQALIGTQLGGEIIKQEVAPYSYTIKSTGEEITLHHKWVYAPKTEKDNIEDKAIKELIEPVNQLEEVFV